MQCGFGGFNFVLMFYWVDGKVVLIVVCVSVLLKIVVCIVGFFCECFVVIYDDFDVGYGFEMVWFLVLVIGLFDLVQLDFVSVGCFDFLFDDFVGKVEVWLGGGVVCVLVFNESYVLECVLVFVFFSCDLMNDLQEKSWFVWFRFMWFFFYFELVEVIVEVLEGLFIIFCWWCIFY